jgi:hypothetical protein
MLRRGGAGLRIILGVVGGSFAMNAACTQLRTEETPVAVDSGLPADTGASDAVPPGLDAAPDAGPDGAPPPRADSLCDTAANRWATKTKALPACAQRQTVAVEDWNASVRAIGSGALSIARTVFGRVGIAVNRVTGPEEGDLSIRIFTPTTAAFVASQVYVKNTPNADIGVGVRIAVGSEDVFHLAYQNDEFQIGGSIVYRTLRADNSWSATVTAASVGHGTHIGLGVSPLNNFAHIAYYVPTGSPGTGRIDSVIVTPGATTASTVKTMQSGYAPDGPAGRGSVVVRVDAAGTVAAVTHLAQSPSNSTPIYSEFAGNLWGTSRRTIDNGDLASGQAGYSVDFASTGSSKHAAYFVVKSGETKAELRVQSFPRRHSKPTFSPWIHPRPPTAWPLVLTLRVSCSLSMSAPRSPASAISIMRDKPQPRHGSPIS